ncbi:MAG: AmmeMemoRadiSam system protein B, partial [Candidatus Roizmanbacteria bacterium]
MRLKILFIILIISIVGGYLGSFALNKQAEVAKPIQETSFLHHDSSPYKKEFFLKLFDSVKNHPEIKKDTIKGIIVNHHLLAGQFIAEAINLIATDKPITVVLVSPNHFARGKGSITSTISSWSTPYGVIKPNR